MEKEANKKLIKNLWTSVIGIVGFIGCIRLLGTGSDAKGNSDPLGLLLLSLAIVLYIVMRIVLKRLK
jgi:hypothetical protein